MHLLGSMALHNELGTASIQYWCCSEALLVVPEDAMNVEIQYCDGIKAFNFICDHKILDM